MQDRAKQIFGNEIKPSAYKKAVKSKNKYAKKFGDDSNANYPVHIEENPYIGKTLGVQNVLVGDLKTNAHFDPARHPDGKMPDPVWDTEKGVIIGNIRMGFGHYRMSMAMASAAHHMGYTPYWMDLNSYGETTCTKIIGAQNDLYSLGSRLSKNPIFNKLIWEPTNYEGFRALSYNASDQKNAELMAPVYKNVPKDIPVVSTHAWTAQAALHADMKHVVSAVCDNWPMALHFAEGSVHTIQCLNAYMGYRILNGMGDGTIAGKAAPCKPMPKEALIYTGHYIDHELVANLDEDCRRRVERRQNKKPMRFLLTIGGAGAQKEIFAEIIKYLIPMIKNGKAALYVNVGDYKNVWDELISEIPGMKELSTEHFDDFEATTKFADEAIDGEVTGIHGFWHKNIFEAVYATNILMRSADVLVTKPSELAFYPIPKLFIRRVGKHEMWGAIHSAEIGDGSLECRDIPHVLQMIDMFTGTDLLDEMCNNIKVNNSIGLYNGAYKVIEIAMGLKNK
ncbi:MAG: hypothetical protein IIZ61_02315 [Lachnospiraceae bacterium]|nr:hypothetical protein [Lachnospiraceae bacterium]